MSSVRNYFYFFLIIFFILSGNSGAEPFSDFEKPVRISLFLDKAETEPVLTALARLGGYSLVYSSRISGPVTLHFNSLEAWPALELALRAAGLLYEKNDRTVLVLSPDTIGRTEFFRKKIFQLNYLSSAQAEELIKPLLRNGEQLSLDRQNHRLVIFGHPLTHLEISEIMEKLDRKEPQVFLEARIMEVSSDGLKHLGIQWPQKLNINYQGQTADSPSQLTMDNNSFAAVLNLLEEKGLSKVLASPRLMVLNNKEADILIGDRIPYPVTTQNASGAVTTRIEFLEAGIKLKITPRINDLRELTVYICPEVSYVYNWKGPAAEIPWVKTRETRTTVRVHDGQTIVIAGLLSEDEKESLSALPVLGQVPGLGNIFSSRRRDRVKSEVIVSVTPHVVSD